MKRLIIFALISVLNIVIGTSRAFALGECGLSCCIAGVSTSGVTLAPNLGLSVQYENSYMETIKDGKDRVSPNEVIDNNWMMGNSYSVPTEMVMEKLSIIAAYPATERFQLLAIVPYVRNNMEMRNKNAMGMIMEMEMDTIEGLGDITVLGLYTAYTDAPIRPSERLTLGIGVKTPTGKNDEEENGKLVHAMMQPGTGSWDPLFMANYMRAYYPLVFQANLLYHVSTKGDEGYEFGDQLSADLIARYQAANYINLGLELNGIHAGKDKDHDGKYSRPATSMVDNTDNTGLTSVFLSPYLQMKIPKTGGSAELKYQHPVYQDVNGHQQVTDRRILTSISWAF